MRKIELWKSSIYTEESDVVRSLSLKNATSHIHLKDADFGAESDPELKAWRATLDLVKTTSNLLLRCLPDFWKLSTSFIEGKFAGKVSNQCVRVGLFDLNGILMTLICQGCTKGFGKLEAKEAGCRSRQGGAVPSHG